MGRHDTRDHFASFRYLNGLAFLYKAQHLAHMLF